MSSSVSCISNERPAVPINVCDDLPELGICFDAEEVGHEELVLCHGWSDNSLEICGTCAGTGTRTRGGTRISAMPYGHEAACSKTRWLTEAEAAWSELRRFPQESFQAEVHVETSCERFLADAAANGHESDTSNHEPERLVQAGLRRKSRACHGYRHVAPYFNHTRLALSPRAGKASVRQSEQRTQATKKRKRHDTSWKVAVGKGNETQTYTTLDIDPQSSIAC